MAMNKGIIISIILVVCVVSTIGYIAISSETHYAYTGIIQSATYEEPMFLSQFDGWRYWIKPDDPDKFISSYFLGAIPFRDRNDWKVGNGLLFPRFEVGDAVEFNAFLPDGLGFTTHPYEASEVKLIET